jgi:hypothetical protein
MNYVDVQWHHSNADNPIRLVSELGADRFETRKIEFWADGRVGYASKDGASRDTGLGDAPVPTNHELNLRGEFSAKEIDARSFQQLWDRYVGRGIPLVECSITFLTSDEGGRAAPFPPEALSGDLYRPHIVVGPSDRRIALVNDRGWSTEDYIGIAFHDGPPAPQLGTEMKAVLSLMYFPHEMYDKLTPGVSFTVREGAKVVGHGKVRRWLG